MSDPANENDIDALLHDLVYSASRGYKPWRHAALTALVAERNGLSSEVGGLRSAMKAQDDRERDAGERCGVSRDLSGCDWPDAVADEVIALKARVAELEKQLKFRNETYEELRWRLIEKSSAQPPAASDMRERLVRAIWPELLRICEKTDTTGANWDLVRINARAQALREADAMIAAMRKEEADA